MRWPDMDEYLDTAQSRKDDDAAGRRYMTAVAIGTRATSTKSVSCLAAMRPPMPASTTVECAEMANDQGCLNPRMTVRGAE